MDSPKENDNLSSGKKSYRSIHDEKAGIDAMVADLLKYLYEKFEEDLKIKGHKSDVIKACMPEWYNKVGDTN